MKILKNNNLTGRIKNLNSNCIWLQIKHQIDVPMFNKVLQIDSLIDHQIYNEAYIYIKNQILVTKLRLTVANNLRNLF